MSSVIYAGNGDGPMRTKDDAPSPYGDCSLCLSFCLKRLEHIPLYEVALMFRYYVWKKQMSENIFIAWGKNESVAHAVSKRLKKLGYFPNIGGIKPDSSPNTFFINSNVLQQMDGASAALVLVQRVYDATGNPTSEFRPNLMFEWGYLQRRLRADAIHVFLINIKREELPSDLISSYSHVVDIINPTNLSQGDIDLVADNIVSIFASNIFDIDLDGLEIIRDYDAYRTSLSDMVHSRRAFNPREAGYFLLHMLQPAFYRNDMLFIKDCLGKYTIKAGRQFQPLAILVGCIIDYYDQTDKLSNLASGSHASSSSSEYRSIEKIAETLELLRGSKDKIFNIFDVLLENFIGLSRLRLFIIAPNNLDINKCVDAFSHALRECSEFRSKHPANDGFVRDLWMSYIERNLGRAYYLKGDMKDAIKYQKLGEGRRFVVAAQLRSAGVDYLADQMDLEIGLSRFDEALQAGASETELSAIVDKYLEPYSPRRVDRVWDRLYAAVTAEVNRKQYASLNTRLTKLKSKHP